MALRQYKKHFKMSMRHTSEIYSVENLTKTSSNLYIQFGIFTGPFIILWLKSLERYKLVFLIMLKKVHVFTHSIQGVP